MSMYEENDTMKLIGKQPGIEADSQEGKAITDILDAMELPQTNDNVMLCMHGMNYIRATSTGGLNMNINDEKLRLIWCEEALQGLAKLTANYKDGYLEMKWDSDPVKTHETTREILQAIVTGLNGIADEVAKIGDSLDDKQIKSKEVAA